jgi:peptidoglycan hydrolase-like protein with peptidoglycan-binding domain
MKKVIAITGFLLVTLSFTQAFALDMEQVQDMRADLSASAVEAVTKSPTALSATAFSAAARRGVSTGTATYGSVASSGAITKTLSYGLKNDPQVLKLQTFLVARGYLSATPDGNFGPMTLAAVKKFQTANGIAPLGLVGPQTRALIQ